MNVWVSVVRRGVAYHAVQPGDRKTPCGRYHGALVSGGEPAHGQFITLGEAEEAGMHPCKMCDGTSEIRSPQVGDR